MRNQAVRQPSVAAAWPQSAPAEDLRPSLSLVEPSKTVVPATAAPDVPVAVGAMVAGSYFALFGVIVAFMARSPLAAFAIAICGLFLIAYFAIPLIFLRVEAEPRRRPSFSRFMHQGLEIMTGHTGGRDALVQMLIVPVLLTLGLAAMGIIGLVFIR